MNNQQAINLLKDLEKSLDDYCELNNEGKTAFGMAITALELFGNSEQLPPIQPDTTTHESIPAETGENDDDRTSGDCISRQAAIDAVEKSMSENPHENEIHRGMHDHEHRHFLTILMGLPSVQPEQHEIGYSECANAMLKMWIDNVLTDGEYNRIMDKLNAHWAERRE